MKPTPDLTFQITGAEPERYAAAPTMLFKLAVSEAKAESSASIHAIVLRCQIRIEPAKRRYTETEQQELADLFGTPERWGQTLRPLLWTHVSAVVPSFSGSTTIDVPVPCSYDFNVGATKYFAAVGEGEVPLCFLFSGTVFYETAEGALQAVQIPWEKDAYFRLPASIWRTLMEIHYPNSTWLCLRKDLFNRLNHYRGHEGLPTPEHALEKLLNMAEEAVT